MEQLNDQIEKNLELRKEEDANQRFFSSLMCDNGLGNRPLDDEKLLKIRTEIDSHLAKVKETPKDILPYFREALPAILANDDQRLFGRGFQLLRCEQDIREIVKAVVQAPPPLPIRCLDYLLNKGSFTAGTLVNVIFSSTRSEDLLTWIFKHLILEKKLLLGRTTLDLSLLDATFSSTLYYFLTKCDIVWPESMIQLVFGEGSSESIEWAVSRLLRSLEDNVIHQLEKTESLCFKQKLVDHPLILHCIVRWIDNEEGNSNSSIYVGLRIFLFDQLNEFAGKSKTVDILLGLWGTDITHMASARRKYFVEATRRYPITIAQIENQSLKEGTARSYFALQEHGVRFQPEIEQALNPPDLCDLSLDQLRDLPTIPRELITTSEELFRQATDRGIVFDVHDNRVNVLQGEPVSETMVKQLDASQDYFSRHAQLTVTEKSPVFIFRGALTANLNSLKLDLNTVTFATWKVEKALKYALRSSTTFKSDKNEQNPIQSILMVIQCYDGMPVIRTKYDDEIVLPRNTQLYKNSQPSCHLVDWGDGLNPLLVVSYRLVPTKRKRV